MATGETREATYADLVALPDNVVGQIIDGVLVAEPRPAYGHQVAAVALLRNLGTAFRLGGTPGGWRLLSELEVHLRRMCSCQTLLGGASSDCRNRRLRRSHS